MKKKDKMLLYSATKSLDVRYVFGGAKESAEIVISGAKSHAVLHTAYENFLSIREQQGYKVINKSTNFATARMTVLFTDTDTDEGYLGDEIMTRSFDIHVKHDSKDRILSCLDLYDGKHNYDVKALPVTKRSRNSVFNERIEQNVVNFSHISKYYDFTPATITAAADLKSAVSGPMFHEKFHHTEQGIMYYLCGPGLSYIAGLASAKAGYFYGVVLDLYTSRMMCCNCNACLLGMQHSQAKGFLTNLKQVLAEEKVQTRENLMLSIRVSASQAPKGVNLEALKLPDDKGVVHEYNPDKITKIFQAENKSLGTKKITKEKQLSLANYQGTIFTSKTFSKKKLEKNERIRLQP